MLGRFRVMTGRRERSGMSRSIRTGLVSNSLLVQREAIVGPTCSPASGRAHEAGLLSSQTDGIIIVVSQS